MCWVFLCRVRQPMCTLWKILAISLWLFSPHFSTQQWHLGAHLKTLSDQCERFSCSVGGSGWEWVFSVYVTKRANTILLGTETKKGKSFWVDNNMTLFIEVDVYIYIIYYCEMGRQKFRYFFLVLFKCVSYYAHITNSYPPLFFKSWKLMGTLQSQMESHTPVLLCCTRGVFLKTSLDLSLQFSVSSWVFIRISSLNWATQWSLFCFYQ